MSAADEKTPLLASGASSHDTTDVTFKPGDHAKKSKGEEKKDTKTASLGELFQYATCADVLCMIIGSLAAIVHGAGWPMLSIVFGDMTNDFISGPNGTQNNNGSAANSTPDVTAFEEQMTKYALYYVYIGAAVMVASYLQISFWTMACERQTYKYRQAFFRAVLRQNIGWFDEHQSGELTTRLADDMERVREGIGDKFSLCLQFFAQFISGFVIGFIKGWKLTLVMMSLTPVLAVAGGFMAKTMASYSKREQEKYAEAGSVAEEVLGSVRTVTSFNGQKQEIKRYSTALIESKKLGIRKSIVTGLGIGFTMLVMFSAYALAFWFGSRQVNEWQETNHEWGLSPGSVFTVFFCVLIGSFSIGNITPHATAITTAKGAAAVVVEILKRKPVIDASSDKGVRLPNVYGNIEFKNVDFSYPTRKEVKVLNNFNLTVEPGQTVALVGASGCGKSTTVNLIQRFYDPDSGDILLDNTNLKDLNITWLRQKIGVVSQEPILFGCSIKENILLGNPGATEADVIEAAKQANAHDYITKLPKQYDTLVGERGAQLSGGQKQRVAIARALVRDPKILLLDEATSALDAESEGVVQAALDKAREGRTTIVVAHRLSTIQNADMIYVLEDGVIVENGKHSELMAAKGAYYQLVTLQTFAEAQDGKTAILGPVVVPGENGHLDGVKNGDLKRQLSQKKLGPANKQSSRQISRQKSKDKSKEEELEEETAEKPGFCRMLNENSPEALFIVLGCIAASVNGCTMPLFAVFFSEIIQVFGQSGKELLQNGIFWSLMFLALGGTNFLANSIQISSFGQSGERLTMRLRLKTFKNILRQDVAYFDDPKHSTGALTTRLATDASMVKNATGIRLATMIQSVVGLAAGLAIAFVFGWKLALVVLACVPIMMLAGAIQIKAVTGNQKRDSELLEDAGKTAAEAVENIRTVQALTREKHFFKQYCDQIYNPYKENMKQAHVYAIAFAFSQGVIFMLYGGAFRYGAHLVALGEMEAGSVYR